MPFSRIRFAVFSISVLPHTAIYFELSYVTLPPVFKGSLYFCYQGSYEICAAFNHYDKVVATDVHSFDVCLVEFTKEFRGELEKLYIEVNND